MNKNLPRSLPISILAVVVSCAGPSFGGVIVYRDRLQSGDSKEPPHRANRCPLIEIIQRHRIRWGPLVEPQDVSCRASFVDIDDLDRGLRTHIDYTTRSYTEDALPEPPLEGVNGIGIGKLKPTGRRRKIAGYSCEEYRGSGESAHWGVSTEVDCISTDAPGVAEFDQVINLLRPLYQKAGYSDFTRDTLDYPDFVPYAPPHGVSGIPLESLIDCCGGLTGYAIIRIELKNIPASAFEPPAGFMKMCDGRCD